MNEAICTVLLITYNHAPYIKRCIDSVLSQKTKYKYIIKIFDDASTDGSTDIILQYKEKYPEKIEVNISAVNQGAQFNIWRAYQSVDTKYCILTETDDYWCDDRKLQMQIDALETHPECVFCGTNSYLVNNSDKNIEYEDEGLILNNPILKKQRIFSYQDFYPINTGGYIPYISARLIRTVFLQLEKVRFKEAIIFDFNQFYWFLMQGKYYYIDIPTSVYCRSDTGICSSKDPLVFLNFFIEKTIDFNKQTDFKIADKICSEVILQSRFRLQLFYKKNSGYNEVILDKVIIPSKWKKVKYRLLSLITYGKVRKKYKEKWKLQLQAGEKI